MRHAPKALCTSVAVLLAVSACGGSAATSGPASPAGHDMAGAIAALNAIGYTQLADAVAQAAPPPATLKDGSTFTLAQSIKDKVDAGTPFNYFLSYATASGEQGNQFTGGFTKVVDPAGMILPINAKAVAPTAPDNSIQAQLATIEAALNTDQIDCLGILPQDSDSFSAIVAKVMGKGIPVFTAGLTEHSIAFGNFTQIPVKEGAQVADEVLKFAKDNNITLTTLTMSSGAPSQLWAQGRMQGFRDEILKNLPDATFINGMQDTLVADFDPAKALDEYKAFLAGNPNVQVIMNTDIGAQYAARAIGEAGLTGKAYSIGWNVSGGDLDQIAAGTQIATFDQNWDQQAGYGAVACAVYLSTGDVAPNTQFLTMVTKDNLDAATKRYEETLATPKPQ